MKDREVYSTPAQRRAHPAASCAPGITDETLRVQHLAALGRLGCGIAHEINTPMQFTGDSLYFLRAVLDALVPLLGHYRRFADAAAAAGIDSRLVEALRSAEQEADVEYLVGEIPGVFERATAGLQRVAEMTRAMQVAGDAGASADVESIVLGTVQVARNEYKYVADVELALEALPSLACNGPLLRQAVLGLLLDAADTIADAIAGTDGRGVIRIGARAEAGGVAITFEHACPGAPPRGQDGRVAAVRRTGRERAMACAAAVRLGGSVEAERADDRAEKLRLLLPLQTSGPGASAR